MPAASTTSRRASALPPEERRAAIIEAVRPLLIEHGESVTTRQIACAAGVAEGTIFTVFADKGELLDAAIDAALDPAPLDQLLREIDTSLPYEQRLIEATELMQQRIVEVWRLISSLGGRPEDKARRSMTDSVGLAEIFESEPGRFRLDPAAAARTLRALTMALTHPMLSNEQVSAEEIVATVLHGIAVTNIADTTDTADATDAVGSKG
jgi:AcrR family transcriptional regulator